MIYLYQTQTGIEPHTDKEFAESTLGLGEPLAELTEQEWQDAEGMARMIDGELFLGPTDDEKREEKAREIRSERDRLISVVDWRVMRYLTQKEAEIPTDDPEHAFGYLLEYVQALRDVPQQEGFPFDVDWPTLTV